MTTRRKLAINKCHVSSDTEPINCGDNQLMLQLKTGDIVWTKPRDSSWWPSQVVSEKNVSFKPKKKAKDGVLVRMYGTYDYLYVDPAKCISEFENFRKQENICIKEVFQKSLQEYLSRVRSSGKSKRKVSESKENDATDAHKGKKQKLDSRKRIEESDSPPSTKTAGEPEVTTPDLSARRVKVMQSLGLIAPLGSPFQRIKVNS